LQLDQFGSADSIGEVASSQDTFIFPLEQVCIKRIPLHATKNADVLALCRTRCFLPTKRACREVTLGRQNQWMNEGSEPPTVFTR
jgi:hypothetical protein